MAARTFSECASDPFSTSWEERSFFQLSCIFRLTLSTWIAFSESLIVHLICFCAVSAFQIGSFISMFALLVEAGSANTRFAASLLCRLSFTVGVPLCAPLALIFENWRHLVLAISCLIFLGLFTSLLFHLLLDTRDFKNVFGLPGFKSAENNEKKIEKENPQRSTKPMDTSDTWKHQTLCVRLVILTLHWICVNSLNYGLTFGAEMPEQNIYIFVVTLGLSGLVGNISGFILLKYFGRKTIAVTALAFSASCYLACAFIPLSNKAIILAITFSARAALELFFILCYLWTTVILL